MKLTPVFTGEVKNGKLRIDLRDLKKFDEFLYTMEGIVEVVVRRPRKDRSDRQNRYYRGVVCKTLGDHLGYTGDEMHQIYGMQFLLVDDGRYKYVRSTTSLSTVEMEDYLANCRMWASSEHQCYIPLPNEVDCY